MEAKIINVAMMNLCISYDPSIYVFIRGFQHLLVSYRNLVEGSCRLQFFMNICVCVYIYKIGKERGNLPKK